MQRAPWWTRPFACVSASARYQPAGAAAGGSGLPSACAEAVTRFKGFELEGQWEASGQSRTSQAKGFPGDEAHAGAAALAGLKRLHLL